QDLVDALKKCFDIEKGEPKKKSNKFFKKGRLLGFKKHPWTTITKWLGEEKARQLYKELTGKDE
ncbi:MAG: hypothetical protein D6714_19690, partial [Bacteroidetes bacterium]